MLGGGMPGVCPKLGEHLRRPVRNMPEGWAMDGLEGAPSEAGRIPKKKAARRCGPLSFLSR
jgi:hypothetical protein